MRRVQGQRDMISTTPNMTNSNILILLSVQLSHSSHFHSYFCFCQKHHTIFNYVRFKSHRKADTCKIRLASNALFQGLSTPGPQARCSPRPMQPVGCSTGLKIWWRGSSASVNNHSPNAKFLYPWETLQAR